MASSPAKKTIQNRRQTTAPSKVVKKPVPKISQAVADFEEPFSCDVDDGKELEEI